MTGDTDDLLALLRSVKLRDESTLAVCKAAALQIETQIAGLRQTRKDCGSTMLGAEIRTQKYRALIDQKISAQNGLLAAERVEIAQAQAVLRRSFGRYTALCEVLGKPES